MKFLMQKEFAARLSPQKSVRTIRRLIKLGIIKALKNSNPTLGSIPEDELQKWEERYNNFFFSNKEFNSPPKKEARNLFPEINLTLVPGKGGSKTKECKKSFHNIAPENGAVKNRIHKKGVGKIHGNKKVKNKTPEKNKGKKTNGI